MILDNIVQMKHSVLQHGQQSQRVYLIHLAKDDMPEILDEINYLATNHGYSKIFAKVPASVSEAFFADGFKAEAIVPRFFNNQEDCVFMGKFLDKERGIPADNKTGIKVLGAAMEKAMAATRQEVANVKCAESFLIGQATHEDVNEMATLYKAVFSSYPFPIFDPAYLLQTMSEHVIYFKVCEGKKIVALASCETNKEEGNVEMTDFAVLPAYRGHKLAFFLLKQMELAMKKQNIKTAYTIARATSYSMNCTFAESGYFFTGVLIKNTHIGGGTEDMNLWFKSLS